MTRRELYALGWYRQARADFETFRLLSRNDDVPQCHRLQFLQMACEKLSKAFRCRARGADPDALTRSHKFVEQAIPQIALEVFRRTRNSPPRSRTEVVKKLRHLARQIELLSPAVDDDGKRADNCEYPWEGVSGEVVVPIDLHFAKNEGFRTSTTLCFPGFPGDNGLIMPLSSTVRSGTKSGDQRKPWENRLSDNCQFWQSAGSIIRTRI